MYFDHRNLDDHEIEKLLQRLRDERLSLLNDLQTQFELTREQARRLAYRLRLQADLHAEHGHWVD
jgi:hypothetical protein